MKQSFWKDNHGNDVIWQKPNIWLIIWFVTMVINWFTPNNWLDRMVGIISLGSIIIWASLEVYSGVNYFRRLIGLLVLLTIIVSHLVTLRW